MFAVRDLVRTSWGISGICCDSQVVPVQTPSPAAAPVSELLQDITRKIKAGEEELLAVPGKARRGLYGNRRTSCSALCSLLVFSLSPRDSAGFLLCLQALALSHRPREHCRLHSPCCSSVPWH